MAIERSEGSDGNWSINATGKDVADLRSVFRDDNEAERERRQSNDHPRHQAPGVDLMIDPPTNIVGWHEGRIVYREPIGNAIYEEVEGGYVVAKRD